MSLSNILQHVKRKGQFLPKTNRPERDTTPTNGNPDPLNNNQYKYNNGETRVVDPVVARLKATRKLEREKKEQDSREKRGLAPNKPKLSSRSTNSNDSRNVKKSSGANRPKNFDVRPSTSTNMRATPSPSHKPVKKMNFNDLMKKASKIDQSKLSVSIKPKTKSRDSHPTANKYKPTSRASSAPTESYRNTVKRKEGPSTAPKFSNTDDNKPTKATPLPIRKPSSKLEERLTGKTKSNNSKYGRSDSHDDFEDDDSESFIVSDEEEVEYGNAPDYDRDEIWAIFNRGKKRSYYDRYDNDSGDDMEATGGEIWEEEMRSKRNAELEDRRELEEQQRLASLKKAKKMKQN